MANGVPVLRHHDIGEAFGDAIDHRNDLLAILHGEAATRQEAVLNVDHEQGRRLIGLDRARRPKLF